jgi:polar amino acid transport system substrate-binding protein
LAHSNLFIGGAQVKKKLAFLFLTMALIAAVALPGCSNDNDDPDPTSSVTKLTVVTDATFFPFEYVDTDTGKIVGFDIDLMRAIADKAGIEVEFKGIEWDALLAGLANGSVDAAISSITITEARQQQMLFSDPYHSAGQIIVVNSSNNTITGTANLNGKTVGVQSGTTGDDVVSDMSGVNKQSYDDISVAFNALLINQIDAIVVDTPVAAGYLAANPGQLKTVGEMLSAEEYGIAMPKGNEALMAKINTALAQIIADGTLDRIKQEWDVH